MNIAPRVLMHREIPEGDAGHAVTVATMRELAYLPSARVDQLARSLLDSVGATEQLDLAYAIRHFLTVAVVFQHDPAGVETLLTPELMLEEVQVRGATHGDCDDIATLAAALALACGLSVRFVTSSSSAGAPWEHVHAEIQAGGFWIECDTSREAQGIALNYVPPRSRSWGIMRPRTFH